MGIFSANEAKEGQRFGESHLHPPHHAVFQSLLRKYYETEGRGSEIESPPYPPELNFILGVTHAIDRQGIDNFQPYASDRLGASFGYTEIDLNSIAEKVMKTKTNSEQTLGGRTTLVFAGYASDAFDRWDWLYNLAFERLPEVAKKLKSGQPLPREKIIMIGYPHRFGGQVSEQWADTLRRQGLSSYAQLYEEFIESHILSDTQVADEDNELDFRSTSLGSIVSDKVITLLRDRYSGLQVSHHSHNPAGHHFTPEFMNTLQMAVGSIGENMVRSMIDPITRYIRGRRPAFHRKVALYISDRELLEYTKNEEKNDNSIEVILANGMHMFERGHPLPLRVKCALSDFLWLARGNPLENPAHIKSGVFDLTGEWHLLLKALRVIRGEEVQFHPYAGNHQALLTLDSHHVNFYPIRDIVANAQRCVEM